jgi:putative transposase
LRLFTSADTATPGRVLHQPSPEVLAYLAKDRAQLCDSVAVVDLKVAALSVSAAGTSEAPGNRVRQKAGLNRAILDQGWAEFRRQLEYKTATRAGAVVAVIPAYTSQECS